MKNKFILVVRSESDQSGYPMNHPSNRRISIRSDYPSDWSDGSSDIRMDPSSDWADGSLLSDGWVSHFFCLKRKRADIRSIRSDPINPMAHHRLKKKTGLRLIRSIRSIRSGPIDPMAHHRLSAAIRGLNFLSRMESSRDHPADGLIGFIRIAPLVYPLANNLGQYVGRESFCIIEWKNKEQYYYYLLLLFSLYFSCFTVLVSLILQ